MNSLIRSSCACAGILALTILSVSGSAAAATLSSLTITGGMLEVLNLDKTTAVLTYGLVPGSSGTLQMGSFQGAGQIVSDITVLESSGSPIQQFRVFTSAGAGLFPGPYAAPQGATAGNTLSVDLGSWFIDDVTLGANPSITAINQGAFATGTLVGNQFSLSWDPAPNVTIGDISGPTRWSLTGTAQLAPVPVPAAFWLFGSGAALLLTRVRRSASANAGVRV